MSVKSCREMAGVPDPGVCWAATVPPGARCSAGRDRRPSRAGAEPARAVRRRTVRTVPTRAVLATVAACALGAGVAATMLLAGGSLLIVVVLVVAQVALLVAVREGRAAPPAVRAGVVGGGGAHARRRRGPTVVSALVYLAVGLVFAAAAVAFLAFFRPGSRGGAARRHRAAAGGRRRLIPGDPRSDTDTGCLRRHSADISQWQPAPVAAVSYSRGGATRRRGRPAACRAGNPPTPPGARTA